MAVATRGPTQGQLAARLRRAAYSGDFQKVRSLLEAGADPNGFEKDSYLTPLHYAASAGHANVCQLLADAGAIVDAGDADGNTPLFYCASGIGSESALRQPRTHSSAATAACAVLLEAGANPAAKGKSLSTPLHAAAYSGYAAILKMLLRKGADPNARDYSKSIPLHFAALGFWDERGDGCRILLEAGGDLNAKDLDGMTPLHNAAASRVGAVPTAILLEAGADIGAADKELRTPLHVAAGSGNPDSARKLVEAGADLFARDLAGKTPEEATIENDRGAEVKDMLAAEKLRFEMMAKIPAAPGKKTKRAGHSKDGL